MHNAVAAIRTRSNFVAVNQADFENPLVLSYLGLRKAVGIIGIALPLTLVVGKVLVQGGGIESSISCYYHTAMRNLFVGSLCAIGIFLLSCRGYDRKDAIAGRLACLFAIGVAFFPTSPCPNSPPEPAYISKIHWSCAALLFLTLAYFCLALFTKTAPGSRPTERKLQRNLVYRACGVAILGSIFLIALINLVPTLDSSLTSLSPVFWLESVAVLSFAVAWLTKGEAILKDQRV